MLKKSMSWFYPSNVVSRQDQSLSTLKWKKKSKAVEEEEENGAHYDLLDKNALTFSNGLWLRKAQTTFCSGAKTQRVRYEAEALSVNKECDPRASVQLSEDFGTRLGRQKPGRPMWKWEGETSFLFFLSPFTFLPLRPEYSNFWHDLKNPKRAVTLLCTIWMFVTFTGVFHARWSSKVNIQHSFWKLQT